MGFFDKIKEKFNKNEDKSKYLTGFSETKKSFSQQLLSFATKFKGVDDEFLEELMVSLLQSDIGVNTADKICLNLKNKMAKIKNPSFDDTIDSLIETMSEVYGDSHFEMNIINKRCNVILLVGINGSGKTTSCAKLAKKYKDQGLKVAVVAADTFRAGAIEQLKSWALKIDVHCVYGKDNQDPSSVLVDGCRYAVANDIDVLLCDTAGRLQNKVNLMNELAKMRKVVTKEISGAPHEVLLVVDSTTGQNGLSQATIFNEVTEVSGVILSKMDGTSKGGIVLAIKDTLNIPVKFIGLGEKADDLKEFDLDAYLYSISSGLKND